jgi:WD40 repeat protein
MRVPVWSVAWSPDGTRIASGSGAAGNNGPVYAHNSARVWDATTGQTIFDFPDANKPSPDPVGQSYAVGWSPNGARLATSDGKIVRLWDATTGRSILHYTGHSGDVFDLAWSPDGSLIASASTDGTVQVWRPQV